MRLLVVLLLVGCAHALTPPAPTCPSSVTDEDVVTIAVHVLADACTGQATDEVLLEHARLMFNGCNGRIPVPACLRFVCVRLGALDEDPPVKADR